MKRVMVFGLPGSGKSFFADQLAAGTGLPLYHIDAIFFVEGWKERDPEEFLALQREWVARNEWIIDGCSMKTLEVRFARADTAVYFRLNRLLCLWRMVKRMVKRDLHIDDLPSRCTKNIPWRLIKYMWRFHRRYGANITQLRKTYPHVHFFELRSRKDVRMVLTKLTTPLKWSI